MKALRRDEIEDAFESKFKAYGDMLYKLCLVYLRKPEDAEEAMQEAFIKLLYHSPSFTDNEHQKRWLIRIAVNICKDKLKSFWHKNVLPLDETLPAPEKSGDGQIEEAILTLPAIYKSAIHLYYYENYKIEEIAEILHLSPSAVKMRLKRGREALKLEWEDSMR